MWSSNGRFRGGVVTGNPATHEGSDLRIDYFQTNWSMQTPGLNHIILTVSDVKQSRAFYGDLLGLDVVVIAEDPDQSFFFTCGGVQFFFFPSRQPLPGD